MVARPRVPRSVNRDGLQLLLGSLRSSFALIEGLNDCVLILAPDGSLVAANRKAIATLADPSADFIGLPLDALVVPGDLNRLHSALAAVERGETIHDFEMTLVAAEGPPVETLARLLPATFDGEIVGIYVIAADLGAQRSIERVFANNAQKFRSLFEHHTDAILIVDAKGRFASINIAAEQMSGFLNEEVVHKSIGMLFPEVESEARSRAVSQRRESSRFSLRLRCKDGAFVDVEGETIPIIIDDVVNGFFAVCRDVTERRRAASEFARQNHRIHQLYRIASSMKATPEEQITGALDLCLKELGFEWAYIGRIDDGMLTVMHSVGESDEFRVGMSGPLSDTMMRHAIAEDAIFVVEDLSQPPWVNDRSGRAARYGAFVGVPILFDGKPGAVGLLSNGPRTIAQTDREYIVSVVALATASVKRGLQHERLDALAFNDTLTSLPNRLLFMDRLEQQLNFAKRHKRSFATHYIDFDRFKSVNDTYGHAVGDAFLIEMAKRFLRVARESDTVARLGGDEFVILQPEITDAEHATEFASRLISATREPLVIGEVTLDPSISIGISVYPHDGSNAESLLKNADTALYCVKAAGRDDFALYDAVMEARPRPRGTIG